MGEEGDKFMNIKAKNNRKNKRGLLDYQKRQLELTRLTEEESKRGRIRANMEIWDQLVPQEYKNAIPQKLPMETINKIKETQMKPPYDKFIIISAKDVTNATFTAYTMIYALLKQGLISPSEIQSTSIMDGYINIHGMFNSRYWKETFFNKSAQLLLVNGTSKSLTKLGSKGEEQFWRELIEHCRNNDRLTIITYATDDLEEEQGVFIPLMTSNKELNTTIIKKSLFITLTNKEEEEITDEKRGAY